MSAYTQPLPRRRCCVCSVAAQVELFNTFNSSCGYFCRRHGEERLKQMHRDENALLSRGTTKEAT